MRGMENSHTTRRGGVLNDLASLPVQFATIETATVWFVDETESFEADLIQATEQGVWAHSVESDTDVFIPWHNLAAINVESWIDLGKEPF